MVLESALAGREYIIWCLSNHTVKRSFFLGSVRYVSSSLGKYMVHKYPRTCGLLLLPTVHSCTSYLIAHCRTIPFFMSESSIRLRACTAACKAPFLFRNRGYHAPVPFLPSTLSSFCLSFVSSLLLLVLVLLSALIEWMATMLVRLALLKRDACYLKGGVRTICFS